MDPDDQHPGGRSPSGDDAALHVEHSVERGLFVRRRAARGRGRGQVLLVHGLGESALGFEELLVRREPADWTLVAPDLPSYGRSAWPAGEPADLSGLADLIATWLRDGGAAPVMVIGHSLGGVIALLLTERHPDRVAALIDVEGNKSRADCAFSGPAAIEDRAAFLAGGFDRLRAAVDARGRTEPALRGYYASLRLTDPRSFHRHGCELVRLSKREDLAARLAKLRVPHHYIAGVPRGVSARSRELLDAGGVAWSALEPAGHWPFIDQPDRFVMLVAQLLDGWFPRPV